MKKISILILIIIVSSLSAIVITPEFPTVYDGNSDFVLRVQDGFNDTEVARMLYREAGEQVFNEIEMGKGSASNPIYEARIPNKKEFLSGIEFYFEIDLKDGAKLTSPELNPQVNPYRIAVKKEESISEGFVLIAPDTAFPLKSDKLLIAISYFAIQDIIIPSSIRFIFNGMDVTSKANISKNMVVLDVDAPKKGKHNFKLEASTIEGNKISSKMWSTNVSAPKLELPLNLSGNISLYGILNAEKDNAAERDANVRLRLQGRKNWFSFKSKLYISSLESSKEQTVNRYRLDLNVPHLRMKFGDYSPDLGAFSHNSVNVRGIFTELDFTKFSMKVLYGNSKRAIKGNLITKVDSLGEVTGYSNNDIEFERRSMALRTEFGHRRYFRFGLNIIKNKDIVESLDESAYMAPDSTLLVKPKDNIVLSTDTKFAFMDQRIIFGAEAAMSLYNSNILDGPITKDSLESIAGSEVPIDPADFEDIFVLSSTIEPFIPSLANLAYKAYFRMFVFHNLINVSYSVVGESFYNLGVGYLGKDMSTLSINDNLSLINNRLLINLAYNINSNNILDNKEFTTSNNGMFAQIYAKPTNNSFVNLSYNSNIAKNDLTGDGEYNMESNVIGFGTGYLVSQIQYAPTKFSLSFSNSVSLDEVSNSFELTKNIVTLTANSEFRDFPLRSTMGYSISMDENVYSQEPNSKYNYHSIFLKYKYLLFDDKLQPFADLRISKAGGDFESSSQLINLGSNYKLDELTNLYAACGFSNYTYSNFSENDSNELNLKFRITRKF